MRKLFKGLFLFTPLLILLIISTYASENLWKPAQALPQNRGANCITANLLESSNTKIALEYKLPEISFVKLKTNRINGVAAERVVIGNALQFSKPGEPVLPFVPVKLILPQGYTIDHIETEILSYKEALGKHIIEYGRNPQDRSGGDLVDYSSRCHAHENAREHRFRLHAVRRYGRGLPGSGQVGGGSLA